MIGRADNAFIFHLLNKTRRLVIADGQFALDIRCRTFAIFYHDGNRLIIQRVFAVGIPACVQTKHRVDAAGFVVGWTLNNTAHIFRWTIGLKMIDDFLDFFVRNEWAVAPGDFRPACHVKHIPHAQQLFGTHFAKDRAAVDFGSHLERNPRGEVGLDRTRDDVHRWALRGHNQMNT